MRVRLLPHQHSIPDFVFVAHMKRIRPIASLAACAQIDQRLGLHDAGDDRAGRLRPVRNPPRPGGFDTADPRQQQPERQHESSARQARAPRRRRAAVIDEQVFQPGHAG